MIVEETHGKLDSILKFKPQSTLGLPSQVKKKAMSEMERDLINRRRRFSHLCGCYMMSPSCFPVHEEMEYSRIDYCSSGDKRRRRWRNLLRRLVRDGKSSLYGSKAPPLSFHYDAVSYSQNFDEGCHSEESGHRRRVFQEVHE
ncbi:hypothetical protein HRI_000076300 [Hibiscus trionum]|uniref:Uncharacterized protein n=1 Tax=Hibiscus trionum TaxID=183268 RepID=A0A9W7LHX2_HIBTR|nr:hypothetical protein HRI_000076300 [Hibiscus trionum]